MDLINILSVDVERRLVRQKYYMEEKGSSFSGRCIRTISAVWYYDCGSIMRSYVSVHE